MVGWPVTHSKSPLIHRLFAGQTKQVLRYEAMEVPPAELAATIQQFQREGGRGLNITLPFKGDALALCDTQSVIVSQTRSVNTLIFDSRGCCHGDSTDGIGLLHDLEQNLHICLHGKRILLLGAGGAVRAILPPLLERTPAQILIANRTVLRAEQLVATCKTDPTLVQARSLESLLTNNPGQFDIIINGTSLGLDGDMPKLPAGLLAEDGCCYDLAYADTPTAFVEWGRKQGAVVSCDGLGMLVEQAAKSFYLWRGVHPPDTRAVIDELRQS